MHEKKIKNLAGYPSKPGTEKSFTNYDASYDCADTNYYYKDCGASKERAGAAVGTYCGNDRVWHDCGKYCRVLGGGAFAGGAGR